MKKLLWKADSCLLALCLLFPCASCAAKGGDLPAYSDVHAEWYYYYVNKSIEMGFLSGTSESVFEPERELLRSEAIAALGRVHEKITGEKIPPSYRSVYPDVGGRSWYGRYLVWAQEKGLLDTPPGEPFLPDGTLTNEEMGALLYRYIGSIGTPRSFEPDPKLLAVTEEISPWAQEAMLGLSGYQIFNPIRPFDPRAAVSRAEGAALLVRMYEKLTFPLDEETPRLKYYLVDTRYAYADKPLEEKAQIVSSFPIFSRLMKLLPGKSRSGKEGPYLQVNEATFADHCVLAVDVPVAFMEDGRIVCEVKNKKAKVTFVSDRGSQLPLGFGDVFRGFRYFLVVPKKVTEVQVEVYHWTEDLVYTQGYTADMLSESSGS